MDRFLCFYHVLRIETIPSLLKHNKLMTGIERCEQNVKARGLYWTEEQTNCKSIIYTKPGQYPGIYLNGMPVHEAGLDNIYTAMIVFPVDILQQNNWHFNVIDQNGYINQNTYCKNTMHLIPDLEKVETFFRNTGQGFPGNELVFHDGLPLGLASGIYVIDKNALVALQEVLKAARVSCTIPIHIMNKFPMKQVRSNKKQTSLLNLDAKPVLTYALDIHHGGRVYPRYLTGRKRTSKRVHRMIAENSGVNQNLLGAGMDLDRVDQEILKQFKTIFKERPDMKHYPPFLAHTSVGMMR